MYLTFYPLGCEIDPADPVGSRRKCLEANAQQEGLSTQAPMLPTKVADVDADIAAIELALEEPFVKDDSSDKEPFVKDDSSPDKEPLVKADSSDREPKVNFLAGHRSCATVGTIQLSLVGPFRC